jgi:hypothetical protein
LVCTGWVFSRAPDFATAALVLRKAVGMAPGGVTWAYVPLFILSALAVAAHVVGQTLRRRGSSSIMSLPPKESIAGAVPVFSDLGFASAFVLTIDIVLLYLFTPLERSPFIYFRF